MLTLAAWWGAGHVTGSLAAAAPDGTLASHLRYIGRDTATGMPASVDDRFIAQVEQDIARYGKDERAAVPPPAVNGVDIASLTVPALGIDHVPVRRFGLDAFGRLDVPQDTSTVGWNPGYTDLPGEGGATFLAAHFEYAGRPGVFNKLSTLVAGDEITVTLSDGSSDSYRVTSDIDYALATIDMGAILRGREGVESLTLMTCSGPPGSDGYPLRTVVLAQRIG
jgi:sortase (surface protein transpeptidase)